jgi:hypothetical protein
VLLLGRIPEAESVARHAITLDSADPRTHCVLGYVLSRKPSADAESLAHLRVAARAIPHARQVPAVIETRLEGQAKPTHGLAKSWKAGE